MTLSAVLFDMDGLLVNTEPLWLEAEYETVAALGGTWSVADNEAIVGASLEYAAEYIRRVSGTERSTEDVGELLIDSMMTRLRGADIAVQPGAAELLHDVQRSGLPFALVSASLRSIVEIVTDQLVRAGLPEFPVTVAGDEVARGKPDPLPYLLAARLLGVDITHAVVLEDSANGVRAGHAAGAHVVAVPQNGDVSQGERIIVRSSLVGLDVAGLCAVVQ